MKKNFIRPLDYRDVLSGGSDDNARLILNIWERSGGVLTDDLLRISSTFVTFCANQSAPDTPNLMHCGKNALAARLLGDDWACMPKRAIGALDDNYLELVSRGYRVASIDHKPTFDFISTNLHCEDVGAVQLRYQRLIVPFHSLHGVTFLFCYSQDAGSSRLATGLDTNAEPLQFQVQRNIGHAGSLMPVVCPK